LAEEISQRTSSTDGLTWSNGINNGGVPIIDYRINMREQGGSYSVIATGITSQSYTVIGLVLGTTYEFTVEAQNSVGFSNPSTSVSFLHAIVPEAPATPSTTNSGTNIVVDWSEPSNNGAEITSYSI
jgi:predicted phage tail protein